MSVVSNLLYCTNCKKFATCIGRYDCMPNEEPACDMCCGHGNEDGYCTELPQAENVRLNLDDPTGTS